MKYKNKAIVEQNWLERLYEIRPQKNPSLVLALEFKGSWNKRNRSAPDTLMRLRTVGQRAIFPEGKFAENHEKNRLRIW
jgi:hypothetical protein